jgi:mannose-6-phosphate isomerase
MLESETRPWGRYEVLQNTPVHKVKCIWVSPGMRLSYQRHTNRAEHWFIIQGFAQVTVNDVVTKLSSGESIQFPIGAWHRIANIGLVEVIFIEVQTGISFEESDIQRCEDDFGRIE